MAKPRVFISSTYYDLKHLRSAFESFLDQFGFEPVSSEKGNIAYAPNRPLDESCYREVEQVDILILIIGGRYGSECSFGDSPKGHEKRREFYERYNSITSQEFRTAINSHVATYILIEKAVYSEYHTYTKNRNSSALSYAHVDSVNIFHMIDEIVSLTENNPIFAFDRYHEIEAWLRAQWASLFKELLRQSRIQPQVASLATQVARLGESNKTLRTYLESLMTHVAPETSQKLIQSETERLRKLQSYQKIQSNGFVRFLVNHGVALDVAGDLILRSNTIKELFDALRREGSDTELLKALDLILEGNVLYAQRDIADARVALEKQPLLWGTHETES